MDKIVIQKPKGLAKALSSAHQYKIPKIGSVAIHTKKIKESTSHTESDGKPVPLNVDETTESTSFQVHNIATKEIIFVGSCPGIVGDEECLSMMGYYLPTYDELQEAWRMKRIMDIGKLMDVLP
jgi:hypothetical protein